MGLSKVVKNPVFPVMLNLDRAFMNEICVVMFILGQMMSLLGL